MEEENQQQVQQGPSGPTVPTEPQQVQQVTKEPQRVTTKDPKKVEAGKRLAAVNHKKREVKKREEQVQLERATSGVNQYYGIGAVIALGVIGSLGYYNYWSKKGGGEKSNLQTCNEMIPLRLTSLRWIKSFLYYKNGQEEYSK